MTEDFIRVLRVLEYTGPRKVVEDHLTRCVQGVRSWSDKRYDGRIGRMSVYAVTLGIFPESIAPPVKEEGWKDFPEYDPHALPWNGEVVLLKTGGGEITTGIYESNFGTWTCFGDQYTVSTFRSWKPLSESDK